MDGPPQPGPKPWTQGGGVAGVSNAGDGKRVQLSGEVNVVEFGCGRKSCWPVGSMAGRPKEEQPVCINVNTLISSDRRTWARSDRTTPPRLAMKVTLSGDQCPIDSVREVRLGATIPFRLGNIPGCLWLKVSFHRQVMFGDRTCHECPGKRHSVVRHETQSNTKTVPLE